VDRSDDMRVFAKVVERSSFAGAAARLSIAATKAAPPSVIATAAWRRGISMRGSVGAKHQMRPAETEDIVYQGSRIAVPPSAHGRGGVHTARMCHRIAVLFATVATGVSLLWSPLVAPSASTAMKIQRSQAAATSRPLGNR
jgi:hypothetical protein